MVNKFSVGDRVWLHMKIEDGTKMLAKFNGSFFTINGISKVGTTTVYHLEGAVSDYGIPYTFLAEWLAPVREVSEVMA